MESATSEADSDSEEPPSSSAAPLSFDFSEFQALGRKLNVAGSWFDGDFGTENAGSFFLGEVKKAARATKKLPMRIEVKFKGDVQRTILQYLAEEN